VTVSSIEAWVLALSSSSSALTCFLSDCRSRFTHASAPWPSAPGRAVLPAPVLQGLALGEIPALGLQIGPELDAWDWESELDQARSGLRISRYLSWPDTAQVPAAASRIGMLGTGSRSDPFWLQGTVSGWPSPVAAIQANGAALLAVAAQLPSERAARFRSALLKRWGPTPWLSAAAVLAASDAGLSRADWRLYGEALFTASQHEEWRQVTTLSVDLIQSTGLLQEWGAEKYAQNHGAFHGLCRRVVEEHQGRLDDPQGDDGLMAYFGLQHAHEDAAARAVRAAWELATEVPSIGFGVRIGITTGRVAVREGLPFGPEIHLAARLQKTAPRNGIVISDSTHALLGPGVACVRLPEPLQLVGFAEPQVVWQIVRLGSPRSVRWQRSGQGRFVGRQRELGNLKGDWFVVRANRRAQYRCLVGEAGIGKSRLLQEFERELRAAGEPVTVINVLGQQEMQPSAFAALVLALEPTPLRELPALVQLARLPQGEKAAAEPYDRDALLEELVAGCLRLAGAVPLCLIVDDAQWLDPSTLDFLERLRLRARSVPLLLVASLREDARGLVRGLDTHDAMTLSGLDLHESMDLIGALSGTKPLSDDVRNFIAERAGGLPLFLEETVRMVGQLVSEPSEVLHGIPATLEGLLMARLDALGGAKPLAQLAAVLGTEFPISLWEEVLAHSDDWIERVRAPDAWQRMVDAGVLVLVAADPPRCRFRHVLIRDAAYESLWSRDRKHLHSAVARVLGRQPAHGGTALHAHHLSAAGELDAAFAAWMQAAREAAAAGADREALVLSQRALDLLPQLPETPELRQHALQLHLLQAARSIALDGYGANSVEAAYLRAAQLCTDQAAGSMRIRVDLGLEACYAMRGDLERARALADAAVRSTPWDGNLRLALQARWAWTNVVFHQGDVVGALAMGEQCLARYEPALHHRGAVQDPAIMFLCYGAWGAFQQGRADEAGRRVQRALDLAQTLDHQFSEAVAHGFAASVALFSGDHAEGLRHAEEAIRRCSDKAFQAWLAHARVMRGRLRAALGDPNAGLEDMEQGLALWTATGARITAATYLALQAEVWLELARPEIALQKVALAQEIAQRHGERYWEAELLRLRGWAQWQLRSGAGEGAAAQAVLRQGLELARVQGNLGLALRGAMALAGTWVESGDRGRALVLLDEAMQAIPGHDATHDARAARAARAAWAGGDAGPAPEKG
jgi:class 3 adenylate cyclase/tetratricopeptide (TPR) repeat protein